MRSCIQCSTLSPKRRPPDAYDAFNRVIQTTDGRGAVSSVTFGPAGQTLSQITPDGTQSFAYDVMGRTITTTLPDGTQQFTC